MTDPVTQIKRDIELEFYRVKLTELATARTNDPLWAPFSQWAERVLSTGEAITGPGVDMTDEERAAAVKLLEG